MTPAWQPDEIERLSKQSGIRAGIRLHKEAEDYRFPGGSFLAKGYAPPGGYVKDFGLVREAGRLHRFHIDGRPGEVCWVTGNGISFGHASTSDYRRWIRHPMPLAVGDRPWEREHVWAPFVYSRGGTYSMFYMGSGRGETFISYATSIDLETWTRWPQGPIRCAVGRDPFLRPRGPHAPALYRARRCPCGGLRQPGYDDVGARDGRPPYRSRRSLRRHRIVFLHPLDGRYVLWFNCQERCLRNPTTLVQRTNKEGNPPCKNL